MIASADRISRSAHAIEFVMQHGDDIIREKDPTAYDEIRKLAEMVQKESDQCQPVRANKIRQAADRIRVARAYGVIRQAAEQIVAAAGHSQHAKAAGIVKAARRIQHKADSIKIEFIGSGLQWSWDESWGLDNVKVELE